MTTVYRLPEEPPVGASVTSNPRYGAHYTRTGDGWRADNGSLHDWSDILGMFKEVTIVEPDPHPTPWTVSDRERNGYGVMIFDAAGFGVCGMYGDERTQVAQRIVDAVNKAAQPAARCGSRGFAGPGNGCVRAAGHPGDHGYADGSGEQDGTT